MGFFDFVCYVCVCVLVEAIERIATGIPRESFSPESGGSVKPRTAIEAMRTQGTMRLKK